MERPPRDESDPDARFSVAWIALALAAVSLAITASGGGTRGTLALAALALMACAGGWELLRRRRP
ncbi:hypothetical protein [Patulibacter americanus]|uniref:hypothetical protein n=1 Tax=Patulibacter americanus TaxID=588672 RepID=UPI0003B5E659|nr:hypothetical protein [Patulibacter americanus]